MEGPRAVGRVARIALTLSVMLVATACGGGGSTPRQQSAGCAVGECFVSFSNLGREDTFSNNLSLISLDGEPVDVVITFSVEGGSTAVFFTDAAGEEIGVDVSAGSPVSIDATLSGSGVVFRYVPDGSIEGGEVLISPAGD